MEVDLNPADFISEVEFTHKQERAWDEEVMTRYPSQYSFPSGGWLIQKIVKQCTSLNQDYRDAESAEKLLENHEAVLVPLLKECCESRSCNKLRRLRLLQKPPPEPFPSVLNDGHIVPISSSVRATEASWRTKFMGNAPQALWDYMRSIYHTKRKCVPFTDIIQSSGMGKSRLVDELAKSHLVIPVCLRPPGQTVAFPPGDPEVYDYLLGRMSGGDYKTVLIRIHVFLIELFRETASVLSQFHCSPDNYAAEFREYMIEDQTMAGPGPKRLKFYKNVIRRAEELLHKYERGEVKIDYIDTDHERSPEIKCHRISVVTMAKQLVDVLKLKGPAFVLSFDEAHRLATPPGNASWSTLTPLRHTLRTVDSRANGPMFTLFLSTTGSITPQFTPYPEYDPSIRVQPETYLYDAPAPFTDLGFDHCVTAITEGSSTLESAAKDEFMAKFGRPMFATRYANGNSAVREHILGFAREKLLGPGARLPMLTLTQQLACLSRRLPIDFMSNYTTKEAREIQTQVERHTRVVLKIEEGFRSMSAMCPSEPLLAEAAYEAMRERSIQPVSVLTDICSEFSVDHGDRGELVGLLLLTMARDRAAMAPEKRIRPRDSAAAWYGRVIPVLDFLQNLFRPSISDVLPSRFKAVDQGIPLSAKFTNAKIYFNHFIKVHTDNLLERRFLWRYACRGAAVLCANSQTGVDAYIPFTFDTSELKASNMGLILCTFKNNDQYSAKPQSALFDVMDPFDLGIFNGKDDCNVPLIRIVFAMAGKEETFNTCVEPRPADFTSYDIWCSGLRSQFYGVVDQDGPNSEPMWNALVTASHGWPKIYGPDVLGLKRMQNPGAADSKEFFTAWAPLEDLEE